MEKISDFICFEKPSQEIVEKYTGKVPEQIIDLWKQYGFGSMLNGYLRLIKPIVELLYIDKTKNTLAKS